MKTPDSHADNGNSAIEKKQQIIKTIHESKKSSSDIYHLIWMNSNVTGVKVNKSTCNALLSYLKLWRDLPLRIRERIIDDITDFMNNDCLPSEKQVEDRIKAHPTVIMYLAGTLPPESDHQYRKELEERKKRESDINHLRIRTYNELKFIRENIDEQEKRFWNDETPTTPRRWDLKLKPYSESFYLSYLGIEGEEDDIEFPDK